VRKETGEEGKLTPQISGKAVEAQRVTSVGIISYRVESDGSGETKLEKKDGSIQKGTFKNQTEMGSIFQKWGLQKNEIDQIMNRLQQQLKNASGESQQENSVQQFVAQNILQERLDDNKTKAKENDLETIKKKVQELDSHLT
jgi:hypothetical protein